MPPIPVHRHPSHLVPERSRVLLRPYLPAVPLVTSILDRVLALSEAEVEQRLDLVRAEFGQRHLDIETPLLANYERIAAHLVDQTELSRARQLLIGAHFSGEYALEAAALFNPSIVPHPDQTGVPAGSLRFVMSLRATGEGHISSIEFRSGLIAPQGELEWDPVSRFVSMPEVDPDPQYRKTLFVNKLREMDCVCDHSERALEPLEERFTRSDLMRSLDHLRLECDPHAAGAVHALDCIQWLADSNYQIHFPPQLSMSERAIFPVSDNESNGIEDTRFVRFVEDDGAVTYYATYTAYNGHTILPQLIETTDFRSFHVGTLNGDAVQNKGMAIFPRRIDGRYAMLSRQDDENVFIMFSDHLHFWSDPQPILRPVESWESVKLGNCGSPIETEAGWLVITHGVGPMRRYCIGAALLDLDDPTRVIGRLRTPLLSPEGLEREGYVPNVVYSCGSLLHGGDLILPYAMSDRATAIAIVPLDALLAALRV